MLTETETGGTIRIILSFVCLGISAIITQIVFMREFLSQFQGNELVIGIILANWLLFTGIGSYLGKRVKVHERMVVALQVMMAVIPLITVIMIRTIYLTFLLPGEEAGISTIFMVSCMMAPFCIVSGLLFTVLATVYRKAAQSYYLEMVGSVFGGLLLHLALVGYLGSFAILYIILLCNLTLALAGARSHRIPISILIVMCVIIMVSVDLEQISRDMQYKGQDVVYSTDSRYSNIVVTKTEDQYNFYSNNMLMFSTANTIHNEETVHYALLQRKDIRTVLLIGGGVSGTPEEILKHGVEKIDYVEIDPKIIDIGQMFTENLDYPEIQIHTIDAREFISETHLTYDAVIIDLPDPRTAQINRYYSVDFFESLAHVMNTDAVIIFSITGSENYMNTDLRRMTSSVYRTVKQVFHTVIIIPGTQTYFIASSGDLSYNYTALIQQKNISTSYVHPGYLRGIITREKIEAINQALSTDAVINTDMRPIGYMYYVRYWLGFFQDNLFFLILPILLTIVYVGKKLTTLTAIMMTTGLSVSMLEFILLVWYQVTHGYLYEQMVIIISLFMAGAFIGAFTFENRKVRFTTLLYLEYGLIGTSILLILLMHNSIVTNSVLFFAAIIGAIAGAEFVSITKLYKESIQKKVAEVYSMDLFGSFIGVIIASVIFVPMIGMIYTVGTILFMKIIVVLVTKKMF